MGIEPPVFCPKCSYEMGFIEVCDDNSEETKTAYACHEEGCPVSVVYIVEFKL